MIASLRELAVQKGEADADFCLRVRQAQKLIYMRVLDEIDDLLGLPGGNRNLAS